jgi:enterobactin synthetase component D / holo-[acyl-carrier protein] synthase
VLEYLVPDPVATAETRQDRLDVELLGAELGSLGPAVEQRRREFVTGRACARLALGRLGAPVVAVPRGQRGEPLWPAGVVGSITHCLGYRGCAVAWSDAVVALGIDAEPNAPLAVGVLEKVAHGRELECVGGRLSPAEGESQVDLPRLLFSAKEAVYKAWFPLTGQWLGFEDVELSIDVARAAFRAKLLVEGPVVGGARLTGFAGRWAVEDDVICTAVAIPAAHGGGVSG